MDPRWKVKRSPNTSEFMLLGPSLLSFTASCSGRDIVTHWTSATGSNTGREELFASLPGREHAPLFVSSSDSVGWSVDRCPAVHSTWWRKQMQVTSWWHHPPGHETSNRPYWPVDDLFIVTTDEYLLLRCGNAECVPLARPRLGVCDVCAQVHVHCPLRQSARLAEKQSAYVTAGELVMTSSSVKSQCQDDCLTEK